MLIHRNVLLTFLLIGCLLGTAWASPTTTVSKLGTAGTSYAVSVANVENAQALLLTIKYDPAELLNPVVTPGAFASTSGAQQIINSDTPGLLTVAYIIFSSATMSGNGQLTTISFKRIGSGKKGILSAAADVYLPSGTLVGSTTVNNSDGNQLDDKNTSLEKPPAPKQDAQTNQTQTPILNTSTVTTGGFTTSDTSTTASAQTSKPEEPKADAGHQPVPQQPAATEQPVAVQPGDAAPQVSGTAPTTDKPVATVLAELKGFDSVMDRFRDYKGARTLKAMAELLEQPEQRTKVIVQKPAVITADGKNMMTIRFQLTAAVTPSFSFKGANLKAIRNYSGGVWELDAVPQKGKTDVRVSIMSQGDSAEIPLTVIPPFEPKQEKELSVQTDAQIEALLAKSLVAKTGKPAYDLNADGKQDYLDDYILVAHWYMKRLKADKDKKAVVAPKKP